MIFPKTETFWLMKTHLKLRTQCWQYFDVGIIRKYLCSIDILRQREISEIRNSILKNELFTKISLNVTCLEN